MTIIIPILAIALSPFLWMVFGRPRFLKDAEGNGNQSISIIIPARDEEYNISKLLGSIRGLKGCVEVIVVNDQSSDRTAEVARELGATVVDADSLPEGWRGKPWACQTGASHAQSDWLLFLDADLELSPNALKSFERLSENVGTAYSVCPRHEIKAVYEELSSFFNLVMVQGVNAFGLHRDEEPSLFGQCLFISAEDYRAVGGHSAVRGETLENVCLARELRAIGVKCECFLGGELVRMRMFPEGGGQLCSSWKKGFAGGAGKVSPKALLYSSLWISGAMFCIVGLCLLVVSSSTLFWVAVIVSYVIYAFQCLWAFRKLGTFSVWNGVLFPVTLCFYQGLFFYSLVAKKSGKKALWKGREVC